MFYRNISENTTVNHDFKVVEIGKEIYKDSTTPYNVATSSEIELIKLQIGVVSSPTFSLFFRFSRLIMINFYFF